MDSAATEESRPHSGQGDDVDQIGRHQSGVFPVYQRGDSVSPESRAAVKAFALRHRETSESTRAMVEAFARRIAVAASCLAVGHPTAMLHPNAWKADEFTFERHRELVKLSGATLENARSRWRMWYRFFTSNHFQRGSSSRRVKPFGPTQLCNFYDEMHSQLWTEQELPRRNAWASRFGRMPAAEEIHLAVRVILRDLSTAEAKAGWCSLAEEARDSGTGRIDLVRLSSLIECELHREHERRQTFERRRWELKRCEQGDQLPEVTRDIAAALLLGVAIGVRDDLVRQGIIVPSTPAPANEGEVESDHSEAETDIASLKPVLCWAISRVDSDGDQRLTRMGEDLTAIFTAVRRWDGSGTRARQLAHKYQAGSVGA